MSADLMYATRNPTYPHGNPSDRCHSVQVRSDLKAKYYPQRLHTHEIVHLLYTHVGAIMTYLSRAFDCLPPKLMITKFHAFGVTERSCELLCSYFRDRYQRV